VSDIVLTPLRQEDSETLFGWINDRAEVLYNAAYRPIHRPRHDEWFNAILRRDDLVIFGIRRTPSDELIGTCQLVDIHSVHHSAELRIRIGVPTQRGLGLGTQAIRQLLAFGFRDLHLHRIWLQVFADNGRAVRVYQKLGFREEGVLRETAFIDGLYKDVRLLAILKDEYDRCHPST
jgi:RimJ/RimL family protein N-acetyltransferase